MKKRILIIDDEIELGELLQDLLEQENYDTVFVSNENEIKDIAEKILLKKESFHLVICDIEMPKLKGDEVIKLFRQKDINYPFIYYTGHYKQDFVNKVLAYGVYNIISKPNANELKEAIFMAFENYNKIVLLVNSSIKKTLKIEKLLKDF